MGKAKELWMESLEPPFEHLKEDGFSPDIDLRELDADDASQIIIEWFFTFFEDPANETPYNSSEGGYLYIWGGPYDAEEEIRNAFDGLAHESAINIAIEHLEREGWEWAPSSFHPSQIEAAREHYEEAESEWLRINGPRRIFEDAKLDVKTAIESLSKYDVHRGFFMRMIYSQVYSILEAYLYDRLRLSLETSEIILKNICENYSEMKKIKYTPHQILLGKIDIKKTAIEIISKEVFHRLEKVISIYEVACGKKFHMSKVCKNSLAAIVEGLPLRHDCVHRNGHNYDGDLQDVSAQNIMNVLSSSAVLVQEIDEFITLLE